MQTITSEPCFHRVNRAIHKVTEPIPHAQQTEVYISDAKSKNNIHNFCLEHMQTPTSNTVNK